ncbi:NEDD8-activating enzyme E1 regulatory subunit [Hibiscus syriacus]|uniref:NEDD8-activating enzyme E1 regulatory subunit n=1 Tax=Hibiscus syriacus TaxID=106335 RepID=A0A6A2YKA0_HIBSY|nr:NEDD8-activating enzyme E1 regulatory subunit [Hibiscus syriacus]
MLIKLWPNGSETLKNLVLGGVGSITILDGSKVEFGDLGNNFMVDDSSLGQSKAKCVCSFLQELNDAVKAKFIEEYPEALIDTNPSFFSQFTLVVATQLVEESMVKLDRICGQENVMLIFARSYGLTGLVRISVKMADERKTSHGGTLPSTREAKREFKELLKSRMAAMDEENYTEAIDASFKVFAPQGISSDLQRIINDSCADVGTGSSEFWRGVRELWGFGESFGGMEFIANEGGGEVPHEGSILDMTSSTERSIRLSLRLIILSLKNEFGIFSRKSVCRYCPIEDEYNNPSVSELQKYLTDEDYSIAVGFYILLRSVDRYAANFNLFPGQFDGGLDEDISRLKTTAVSLVNDWGCTGLTLTEDLINEMCRFGAAELHAVAAVIGGIASQEVIKLITKQFVPMSGTSVFNAIDHRSQLLTLY